VLDRALRCRRKRDGLRRGAWAVVPLAGRTVVGAHRPLRLAGR